MAGDDRVGSGIADRWPPEGSWAALRDRLVAKGQAEMDAPAGDAVVLTSTSAEANAIVTDLNGGPHGFLLACLAQKQVSSDAVWQIPWQVGQRTSNPEFSFDGLAELTKEEWERAMRSPTPLHRFPDVTAGLLFSAVRRLADEYDGHASRVWSDQPPSARLVRRLRAFDGVGPKIASMTANLLVRLFKIPLADHVSIDVAADGHVRRVHAPPWSCQRHGRRHHLRLP